MKYSKQFKQLNEIHLSYLVAYPKLSHAGPSVAREINTPDLYDIGGSHDYRLYQFEKSLYAGKYNLTYVRPGISFQWDKEHVFNPEDKPLPHPLNQEDAEDW